MMKMTSVKTIFYMIGATVSAAILGTPSIEAREPLKQANTMPTHQSIKEKLPSALTPPDARKLLDVRVEIHKLTSQNPAERRAKVGVYLNSIEAANSYLKKHPATGKVILRNVVPHVSTGLPPGVDPAAVKDPKLRAEYEAAIKRNAEAAKAEIERRNAEDFRRQLWDDVVRFCTLEYGTTEADRKILAKDVSDFKESAKLLEEVATRRRQ